MASDVAEGHRGAGVSEPHNSAGAGFDPVIHAPGRLQICGILSAAQEAEFAMIRDTLQVSDSVLSKHLKLLEDTSYIRLRKAPFQGRQRTWVSLTARGRVAFTSHLAELTRLAGLTPLIRAGAAE